MCLRALLLLAIAVPLLPSFGRAHDAPAVLWVPPFDIAERDLFHGPGGEATAPHGPMRIVDGERSGTTPKLRLRDAMGQIWIAKLGSEARPETAASRLLWAVGFAADPGYFVAEIPVTDLPAAAACCATRISSACATRHTHPERGGGATTRSSAPVPSTDCVS
jgi:hypothetical protein